MATTRKTATRKPKMIEYEAMVLVLYRKATIDRVPTKMTEAERTRAGAVRKAKLRVQRPALLAHLLDPAGFASQPALPQAIIDSRADRMLDHQDAGWVLPESDLGRCKGEPDKSTAESVRIWVRTWVPEVPIAAVAIVPEVRTFLVPAE